MIPRHVGIIMDGNGRWAQKRGLPRTEGYKAGLAAMERVLKALSLAGVEAVTVYAFSTENAARPAEEISAIADVVVGWNNFYGGNMRVRYSGDIDSLGKRLSDSVCRVAERTARNNGMQLNILLNYGGRADILKAASVCAECGKISEEVFCGALASAGMPPLDLIVRSGGEKRLSGFMLYEAAYAELYFSEKLWPDFDADDVKDFLDDFSRRIRKFGA